MRARWKRFRHRYEWFWVVLATKIIPLLPRKVCFHLANGLGGLWAKLDVPGRKVARSNLEGLRLAIHFPPRARTDRPAIVSLSRPRTIFDLAWSPRLTRNNFGRWIEIENLNEVMAEIDPGQSCIFPTVHYGNFEWTAQAMGLSGLSLLILTQEFKNPFLDPIVAALRHHPGHETAGRERGMIRMFKALKRGRHVAILSDLTLRPTQPSVAIDCFGLKKPCVTYAHARLHKETGAPLLPLYCEHLPGGRGRLDLQRKLEILPDATETECTGMLESLRAYSFARIRRRGMDV